MANGPALAKNPIVLKSGKDLEDIFLLGGEPAGGPRPEDEFPTDAYEIVDGVWVRILALPPLLRSICGWCCGGRGRLS